MNGSSARERVEAGLTREQQRSRRPSAVVNSEAEKLNGHSGRRKDVHGCAEFGPFQLTDFYSYMESPLFLHVPTRGLWPATKVNACLPSVIDGGTNVSPSNWLSRHRPITQLTWHPGMPMLIEDVAIDLAGHLPHKGLRAFNLYRPPADFAGDPTEAGPWRDHLRLLYPDDADHLEQWLAHRLQYPQHKCNHALVLGGSPGIGKDTLLVPVREGVGAWNWHDITPQQMIGRFNGWAKSVVLRVSEARDLGEVNRFALYEHSKTIIAAPPEALRVDEKNLREHYIANVCGVIYTTNNRLGGLYLPAEDRRHYVAWSTQEKTPDVMRGAQALHPWYAAGGIAHVVAYLRALDLSEFDAKAPPPKTPAFWSMVQAGESPDRGELHDVVEHLGRPEAITLGDLIGGARALKLHELADELSERKNRRSIPHKLNEVGYVAARNPDANDTLFVVGGRRVAIYALSTLSPPAQLRAARRVGK